MTEEKEKVTEAELFVERTDDGSLTPIWEEAPGIGDVKVIPLTYGKVREYFGQNVQMDNVSSENLAEILRNHVVEPDLSDVTEEEVDNKMKMMAPQSLVLAVLKASGVDVNMDALQNEEEEAIVAGN